MNEGMVMTTTEELATLIGLARASGESNRAIIDHIADLYQALGWRIRRYPRDDAGSIVNLVAEQSCRPEVLFCVHTDTVPPGDPTLWTTTGFLPRSARMEGDRVYGLGASDTLGSMAVLNTLSREGAWPVPVAILFSADEEIGALGAADTLRLGGIPDSVRLVVVCEPTNNLVVQGEKGYVPFDVVARGVLHRDRLGRVDEADAKVLLVVGQEAHSARPEQGRNALFEAAQMEDLEAVAGEVVLGFECRGVRNKVPGLCAVSYVTKDRIRPGGGTHTEWDIGPILGFLRFLQSLADEVAQVQDEHFNPPQVTLNVGAIQSVADEVVLACDLRPVPGLEHRAILDRVLSAARSIFPDATLRFPHPPLPPVWTTLPNPIPVEIAERIDPFGKSAYTEAAIFAPAGFPTVIAGPGNLLVHRSNEYVDVSALEAGKDLYLRLASFAATLPVARRSSIASEKRD